MSRQDFSPPRRSLSPVRGRVPPPPAGPPPSSPARRRHVGTARRAQVEGVTSNQPPLEGRSECHLQAHAKGASALEQSHRSDVPLEFLASRIKKATASSERSENTKAANVIERSGSYWCSQALKPLVRGPVAPKEAETPTQRSTLKGALHSAVRNLTASDTGISSVANAVMQKKKNQDFLRRRSNQEQLEEEEQEAEDPFESTPEWLELTFPESVLLSSLSIRWARHYPAHYCILVQSSSTSHIATVPFWMPSVAPPLFTLEDNPSAKQWRVVHVEREGQGGMEVINFPTPVCAQVLRVYMTRPGNTAGVSLSECFYTICGISAEPLFMVTGAGLSTQYFGKPPLAQLGLFARAGACRLEPMTKPSNMATNGNNDYVGGDGILGLPAGKDVNPRFVSMTGFFRIEQPGEYMLQFRPINGTLTGVKFRLWIDEDPLKPLDAKMDGSNRQLGVPQTTDEEDPSREENGHQKITNNKTDKSEVILYRRYMHLGCHAIFIEIEAESVDIPLFEFSYCGLDTGGQMRLVQASNLSPPSIADASLKSLAARPGGLPNFAPHVRSHKVPLLPYNISEASIIAVPSQAKAKMYVASSPEDLEKPGSQIAAGSPSTPLPLAVGATYLYVRVIAEDLKTRVTYRLEILRDIINDCHIMELEVTTPACVGTWFRTYEVPKKDVISIPQLPYFALSAVVTVKTRNDACSIYIAKGPSKHRLQDEENCFPTGKPSLPISLHVGFNVIYVRVLSADRRLSRNWTISIERLASSDATLKIVSVSPGNFRQFLPSKDEYAIDVPFSANVRSCVVHAEANHADAKIYIAASDPRRTSIKRGENRIDRSFRIETLDLALRVGANTLYIRVVAQDNTTSKTYTVHCTCLAPPLLSLLPPLSVPVTFAASSGAVPDFDDGCLKMGESAWWSGGPMWSSDISEDGTPEWVEISLGTPLLVASVKVHWKGNVDPAYTVFIRGQSLRELGVGTGPVPLCVPLAQMGEADGSEKKKRTTRTGWQVEHFAEAETGNTTEVIDLESMEDDIDASLPKNLVDNLGRGWRLVARGQGDAETPLVPSLVIRSLRIAVLRPKIGEALSIDSIELLPPTAQAIGCGLVTEFFLGDTQRLSGGNPDIVALEPSLDGMNESSLSAQIPGAYTAPTWAARYHGLLDILDGGNYTFWVETDRQREDQNVLWRLSIDSQILEIQEEEEEPIGRKRRASLRKSTKRSGRPTSASRSRAGDSDSNYAGSDTTGHSATQSEAGESSSGGPADSDQSDTGSNSSKSLTRCSSSGSITPQRTGTGTTTPQKAEKNVPTEKKKKKEKVKKRREKKFMVGRLGSKANGMNLPLLPGAHHINLEILVLHNKPLEKSMHKVEEELRTHSRMGSRRPSNERTGLTGEEDALRLNDITSSPVKVDSPVSPRSPRVRSPERATSPTGKSTVEKDEEDRLEKEQELEAKSGVKLNLSYRGPDTKGYINVVPPVALAPPWASLRHEVLKPTAKLQVRSAVGRSWHAASVMMMEWMEDEIFIEQLHSVSAHSLDQEGHYLGACQLTAVYDEAQHCGTRLKGLRIREWTYTGDSVPTEILDSVAELASSRRFIAFASSSDLQYDEAVMRSVIPNVLMLWYLDADPEPEDCVPVQYEMGSAFSAQEAGDNIAKWMQTSGLRRGDLLSMTVHPKRAAGARQRKLGPAGSDTTSEPVEWIVLYRARGPRRRRAARADNVKCSVWSMQKSWQSCFSELTHSHVSSQTLIAYASTCLLTNGYISNVQVALWQPSMSANAEPMSDDEADASPTTISPDKGQETPSQGSGRNTALQSTACPSVASRPMSRVGGSRSTPLGIRLSIPSPGPAEQSERDRLQALLPFNAEVDCDFTLEDLLPERPQDILTDDLACLEDEEGEKSGSGSHQSPHSVCASPSAEVPGPTSPAAEHQESAAVVVLNNIYKKCISDVEERLAVARYVRRLEYELILRIDRPQLCYTMRMVHRAGCIAYARQYVQWLTGRSK
eukprot:gnl/MRDRNA2_/MRDRNA2_60541_c0_seq1.p1 gnl/MRDRNA2_/MRDRNA2_60541_c0~~gnl/MRDRNA2_/MRDRNA2_60541_c0_seq1.p1  ORF type:complete len:2078 (-),score=344.68 gnl/MRDRNA2_/MRDRNA2_60541_c0_seq1:42-5999(-)